MKVIIFGATGMVGGGVLRECLLDSGVERVLTVGRKATGRQDGKLREIVHGNLLDLSAIERELIGYDACFFCLGVSSVGMNEADYRRVTYGMTMAAAETLVRLNPGMTFVYVTGAGTVRRGGRRGAARGGGGRGGRGAGLVAARASPDSRVVRVWPDILSLSF